MTIPTVNDVQGVEPLLTNLLVGYQQNDARFVASRVFPQVQVPFDSGTYWIFTKKYWFTNEMKNRAPGQEYARTGFGVETGTYSTLQWALAYPIADEVRRNSQIPLDLETAGTQFLAQKSSLRKEISFSTDFMTTGQWGTDQAGQSSGAFTKWSTFQSSDPVKDVFYAKRTVSNNTGMDPNTMVMGYIVLQALMSHPDLLDRIKYTTSATQGNIENALAALFGVQNFLVGKAVYSNTNEASAFSATAIVDDDCLVTYVAPNPGLFTASAGYTFAWNGGGGMGVIVKDRDGLNDTDLLKEKEQWDQVKVAGDLGFFLSDIVD